MQLALAPRHARRRAAPVAVRALDQVGNPDATPATAEFTVGGGTPARTDPMTSVRLLAERLVINLRMTVGRIREAEIPKVLRRGAVRVQGISSLVPGTLAVRGPRPRRARAPGRAPRQPRRWMQTAPGTLTLRLDEEGPRADPPHAAPCRCVLSARFAMRGLVMSAAEKATLVRDWITPDEARRAVIATLRRSTGSGAKNPSVEIGARCGSGCLAVRAEWVSKGARWSARGRARQVAGRVRADLDRGGQAEPLVRRRPRGSVRPRGSSPSSIRRRMSPLRFGLRYTWRWPTLGFCSSSPASRSASPTAYASARSWPAKPRARWSKAV